MQFSLLKTLLQIYKGLPLFGVIYDEQDSKIENESGENRRVYENGLPAWCRPAFKSARSCHPMLSPVFSIVLPSKIAQVSLSTFSVGEKKRAQTGVEVDGLSSLG